MRSKNKHIGLFLALLLLFAGGCINDEASCPDPLQVNTVGYMSIRLQTADGVTRDAVGDGFDAGEKSEFALAPAGHHFALFYNAGQTAPVAIANLTSIMESDGSNKTANSSVVFAAIAARSEQRDLLERLEECFVVLNTDLQLDQMWTISKEELQNLLVGEPYLTGTNGQHYFTMANAVYIENGARVVASPVDTSKIYTSYMEAIEQIWKGNAAVEAHVERIAAKFGLRFTNDAFNNAATEKFFTPAENQIVVFSHLNEDGVPYYEPEFYNYRVKITGWGLNAIEQQSYLFRKFNLNGNYFNNWFSATNRRVYWSEDRNYTKAAYPWQYRQAVDLAESPWYEGHTNILRNRSYEELNSRFSQTYQYAPENTYNFTDASFSNSLDGRPELLAGTHLIVCAELQTNIEGGGTNFRTNDLYRDRNGNFYRTEIDCVQALVAIFNNTLTSSSFLKYPYYDWTSGGSEQLLFARTKGEYSLYYNNEKLTPEKIRQLTGTLTSEATVKDGDGKRLIWLDGLSIRDEQGRPLEIYTNIDEVDSSKDRYLREATVDDIKSILYASIGAVDHFSDGKMYYAIPVGYIKDEANSTENADAYSVYGVVRNCVYDIVIHDVTGIGTSVDQATDPIIPNKGATNDHLFISFDILDWHLVEQDVPGAIS